MAGALRVVLDTNTVLSALVFAQGRLSPLRLAWCGGALRPLVCARTVAELLRVLAYPKFALDAAEREELLADYLPFAEVVDPWQTSPPLPVCRDPRDQVFLELAAVGAARWLVTGDEDLLALAGQLPFDIIAPAAALGALDLPS